MLVMAPGQFYWDYRSSCSGWIEKPWGSQVWVLVVVVNLFLLNLTKNLKPPLDIFALFIGRADFN